VDLRPVEAWREGRIVFENSLLSEAIAEVNRYGGAQIVLSDPSLGAFRISGVFRTAHPEGFVEAVTRVFPVRVINQTSDTLVLGSNEDNLK